MKSKEALETLVYYATLDDSGFEPHMKIYAKIIEKNLEVLETLKKYLVVDENYYSQGDGSTKAIKICIPNCISVEEDDDYIDDCYPNYDYEIIEEWLDNDK